jgi:hypothetical protein
MSNQLEWERIRHVDPLDRRQGWHYVSGKYRVEPLVDRRWYLFGRHARHLWNAFGTLRAAKAAAQADYEESSK